MMCLFRKPNTQKYMMLTRKVVPYYQYTQYIRLLCLAHMDAGQTGNCVPFAMQETANAPLFKINHLVNWVMSRYDKKNKTVSLI